MDDKHENIVVICGARCAFQKDGKCRKNEKTVVAIIGNDTKCVRYEPADEK